MYLNFISLAEPLTDEGGEETGVPGENPWRRASENVCQPACLSVCLSAYETARQDRNTSVRSVGLSGRFVGWLVGTARQERNISEISVGLSGWFVGWLVALTSPATCWRISGDGPAQTNVRTTTLR